MITESHIIIIVTDDDNRIILVAEGDCTPNNSFINAGYVDVSNYD